MSNGFRVPPLSRLRIREMAAAMRGYLVRITGNDAPQFPIVEFLDVVLPTAYPDFRLQVVEKDEMGDCHGMTYPEHDLIQIREDVYMRAADGHGRDRMTMAHELGHYVLHSAPGLARGAGPRLALRPYEDSEWQADAFGGELLISHQYLLDGMTASHVAEMFGVSIRAAEVQLKASRGQKK